MTTGTHLTATELVDDIVDVLAQIQATDGIPDATRQTCGHSLNSIHESFHGLTLWLRELLEWAPLRPETRAQVARLSSVLVDAESGFHSAQGHG